MNELDPLGCEALHLYLDGELATVEALAFEKHLEGCASCRSELAEFREIREHLRQSLTRVGASAALESRIAAAIKAEAAPASRKRSVGMGWPRLAAAAAVLIIASSSATFYLNQPSAEDRWVDGIVNAHDRAMLAGHEIDVVSSNRHTVKPWFTGKTSIAPLVVDLSDAGYPLVGGRLDVPVDQATPAIVYKVGPHVLSLYMRPGPGTTEPTLRKVDGFSVLEWRQNGFVFTAVSDADGNEVRAFQKAFAPRAAAMP
ncbi:MAG TPA: anti-sigma factor [Dongiaceae bacterium]|jgi:anti-sigma factor RsiW